MTLARQIQTYQDKLPELLPEHEGKFALVYDDKVTVFDRAVDAEKAGRAISGTKYGHLVMRIAATAHNPLAGQGMA